MSPQPGGVLLLICFGFLLVDFGDVHANAEIREWMLRQKEISMLKEKKASLKDGTVTRAKVTNFQSKYQN